MAQSVHWPVADSCAHVIGAPPLSATMHPGSMAAGTASANVSANAVFADAVTQHLGGNVSEAIALYERALALDPNHAEAHNNLASLVAASGGERRAEQLLLRAARLKPDYGEAHNNLGILLSEREDHTAALAAFQRAVALDGSRAGWLNNLGNAYVALFRFDDALTAYDRALAINRDDAEGWANRGLALRGLRRPDDAVESLQRALALAPSHVNSLSNLGIILKEARRLDEAEALLRRATDIDPANPKLWGNFAAVYEAMGDYQRMRQLARHALELDPNYAESYNLLANGEMEAGRYDASLAYYQQALALDPSNRNANWNIALIWLLRGDFERGWRQFEWRKRLQSVVYDHGSYRMPEWAGAALAGRDLLIHSEQGIGDAIQFVRYAPLLKARGAGRVYLECPYPIVPLMRGVRGVDDVIARGTALPPHDLQASLMSLPWLLGTTLETVPADVPYILVEPRAIAGHVTANDGALAVGFVWAGNPIHARDALRSAPLDDFRALVQTDGTQWFSLQKGDAAERQLAQHPVEGVIDLAPQLLDFRDTAAAIDALDLVITVDTSVAHLAGALGRETWLLLPHVPDFRWMLDRSDSPWYPTMRLFRQAAPGDWSGIFEDVKRALAERIARHRRSTAERSGATAPVVTLSSVTRVPDGRPRFDLWAPLAFLADTARFAEYESELVGSGHDLAVRTFVDEWLAAGDVLIDLQPGLGLTTMSAVTAPVPPAALVLVEGMADNAERIAQLVSRRAPGVRVVHASDPHDAMQRGRPNGEGRLMVRVGDPSHADRVADAVGRTSPDQRPAVIAWSATIADNHRGCLLFFESLGYVTLALTIADGESSLNAITDGSRPGALLTVSRVELEAMERRANGAAPPSAGANPASVHRPVALGGPAPTLTAARCELGIDWELRGDSGWGVYGTHLALELERTGAIAPAIFAADTTAMAPITRFRLRRALNDAGERMGVLQESPARLPFAGTMLRALGNNFGHGALWDRVAARRNVGVIFFEDSYFDAGAMRRARQLDLIVTGSRWNESVLRGHGLTNLVTVLQGIDPSTFFPQARSGHLADRFVVFSGGKLEYRKGQDLVVAAFRIFRQRHPEAVLMTAWHNNWPQLITDLEIAGHVRGMPRLEGGRLEVVAWLGDNGIPIDAVLDVGYTPNALMGHVVREADVALFPNRCEGGTNLVAMECMASGVPTIVSNNSGHRDLVATEGCLALTRQQAVRSPTQFFRSVEGWGESDVDEMVQAMELAYTAKANLASIAAIGATALARMSWTSQVAQLLNAIAPLP